MPNRQTGRRRASWAAVLIASWSVIGTVRAQVRGDGIAAIVGATTPRVGASVILLSDVELRARLALAGEGGGELPLGPLSPSLLQSMLQEIIGEVLIAREAERVQLATPEASDIETERQRLEQNAGGRQRMQQLLVAMGASPSEVDQIVERRALVAAFLRANLEGTQTISDAEVEAVFQSGEHPFLGQSLDDVREPMRVWLSRQALGQAVQRWVSVLRSRTPMRILARYAGGSQ